MVLTPEQKKELEDTGMNPNIPLAATKTNLWPKTIPWDMESSICKYKSEEFLDFCKNKCIIVISEIHYNIFFFYGSGLGCYENHLF